LSRSDRRPELKRSISRISVNFARGVEKDMLMHDSARVHVQNRDTKENSRF